MGQTISYGAGGTGTAVMANAILKYISQRTSVTERIWFGEKPKVPAVDELPRE